MTSRRQSQGKCGQVQGRDSLCPPGRQMFAMHWPHARVCTQVLENSPSGMHAPHGESEPHMSFGVVHDVLVAPGAHVPAMHVLPMHVIVPLAPHAVALQGEHVGAAPHAVPSVGREQVIGIVVVCTTHTLSTHV